MTRKPKSSRKPDAHVITEDTAEAKMVAQAVSDLGGQVVHFFDQIMFMTNTRPHDQKIAELEKIGGVIHYSFDVETLVKTVAALVPSKQRVIMFHHPDHGTVAFWEKELVPGQLTLVGYDQYCVGRNHLLKMVCESIYGDIPHVQMMYGEIDLRDYITSKDRAALVERGDPLPIEPEGCGRPDCEACESRKKRRH